MKTTHTPGPWETDYLDQNKLDGNSPCRVRAQKRTVAWVDFWQDESYATQLQMNEQKANARLIAAAPELLEALETLLDCSPCQNGCDPSDMTCASNLARAAIAKAKGQS